MLVKWDPMFDAVCGADIRNLGCEPQEDSGVRDWLHGRAEAARYRPQGPGSTWASAAAAYGIGTEVTENKPI